MNSIPLKRVARIRYGLGQPPPLSDSGVPIIRATNISRGRIDESNLLRAELGDLPLDRAPLLSEGEILVVRSGAYTGDSARVPKKWAGSAPGYDLRVTPINIDSRYAAWSLLSTAALNQMRLASSRAAQPHLNAEELGEVEIHLPPLAEQHRIADYLDAETRHMDAMTRAREAQLRCLQQLWQSRLAATADELLEAHGLLPLRRVVNSVEQGWSPQCDDAVAAPLEWAVLKTNAVSTGTFLPLEHKRLPSGLAPDLRYRIADGDILMTRGSGSPSHVGVATLADTQGRNLLLSDLLYRIRMGYGWSPRFVTLMLNSQPVRGYMSLFFRGQSGQTIKLRAEDIKSISIPAAPNHSQDAIAEALESERNKLDAARAALTRSQLLLSERRQALITAAVTGQFDVSTAGGRNVTEGVSA